MGRVVLAWCALGCVGCLAPDGVQDAGAAFPAFSSAVALEAGQGTLTVPVPQGATSALVWVHGVPQPVRVWVAGWEMAAGPVLLGMDGGLPPTLAQQAWSWSTGFGLGGACRTRPGFGEATAQCGTAHDARFGPGNHQLTVVAHQHPDGGPYQGVASVTVDFAGPRAGTSTLPVRLHVATATGVTQADPLRHPGVVTMLDTTATLLRAANITLEVRGLTAPRGEVVLDAVTLRSDALADLTAVMPQQPGVDVFALETLLVTDDTGTMRSIPALSTNLPLVTGQGSVAGMILLRAYFGDGAVESPDLLGTRLAHELGHALGLFHPLEFPAADGTFVEDTLEDTSNDATGVLDLLMHHTPLTTSTTLTPQQVAVARQSPALR